MQHHRQRIVGVREVGREEGRERPKSQVHRLASMANGHLVALRHGDVGGVHQKMLQNLLHTGHRLLLRRGNQRRDARSLHGVLSKVRLEDLEVFVCSFRNDAQILREGLRVLHEEAFCALQHLELPHRIHKHSSKLWRVPP